VSFTVDGLAADQAYYYGLEVNGHIERDRVGRFRTFPEGPASFTFVTSACSRTGSNGQVFDAIRKMDPLFFMISGDFYYGNIDRNERDLYRAQFEANLTAPAQAALYASAPIGYVWDDHDYDGNDSDRTAVSRGAAHQVYRQNVPL
jgi:phosphodiesterase/alkaline phosphatase D-like protein